MIVRFWRWLWGGRSDETHNDSGQVPSGDIGGRAVFRFLLLIIPIATLIAIGYINFDYSFAPSGTSPTIAPSATAPVRSGATPLATPITPRSTAASGATAPAPSSSPGATAVGALGAFDPGLGDARRFLISLLIFVVAAIIETSLFLIYGAFYVNSPVNNTQPLGLPNGTVRVFLLILVVLVILAFAFLPSGWGENKAVTFLFGALSTVVGFYYGSNRDDTATPPPTILTAMPNTLTFTATATGADPDPQQISVSGLPTNTRLTHSVEKSAAAWLKVTPPSPTTVGILYAQVTLTNQSQRLAAGTYLGAISLISEGAGSLATIVHVILKVTP